MQYHLNASSATDLVLASTIANVTNQTIYDSIKAARDSGVSNTNKNIMKESVILRENIQMIIIQQILTR